MTVVALMAGLYLFLYPLILRLLCVAHKQVFIVRKMNKMPKSKAASANLPKPLWPKIKERVRFALKDQRPLSIGKKQDSGGGLTNKQAVVGAWFLGLAATAAAPLLDKYIIAAAGPLFFITALTIALVTASPIIKGREQIYKKMFEIGKSTLGLSAEYAEQPQAVIQIQDWRDILAPSKVQFEVPTTFSASGEENFLLQFNQVFGTETTWVAFNDPETGKPGWNYADGVATFKETPPLPQKAPWDEHYVLDPSVAWSFFPIGLGVEDGIELVNPATGETENVLGFDVSGVQQEVSKKMGTYCSPTITTSPMVLAAGGTGGGKALAVGTSVRIIKKADPENHR